MRHRPLTAGPPQSQRRTPPHRAMNNDSALDRSARPSSAASPMAVASPGGATTSSAGVDGATPSHHLRLRSAAEIVQAKQEQRAMVALLQGTIADTFKEPPPGVSPAQLAARRAELEELLAAVQRDQHSTYRDQADFQTARWMQALTDQERKESQILADGEKKAARSAQHRASQNEERQEKFDGARERLLRQTVKSHQHLIDTQLRRIADLEEDMRKKTEQHDSLQRRREQEQAELHAKHMELEAATEQRLQRRAEYERQEQERKEAMVRQHRQQAEERAEKVRLEKERRAQETRQRQRTANLKGALNRVRVDLRGPHGPRLRIEELDYGQRLDQLTNEDRRRTNIVKMLADEAHEDLAARFDKRAKLTQKAEDDYNRIVDQRMKRQLAEKHERERAALGTEEQKERKQEIFTEASTWKSLMVYHHTQLRDLRLLDRQNASHRKVFDRMSRKAVVIAQHICRSRAFNAASAKVNVAAGGAGGGGPEADMETSIESAVLDSARFHHHAVAAPPTAQQRTGSFKKLL